ncbi:MAG: BamA/TamA family outer membrane protein [Gemmatimonadetes bacterium]|nr:BamA/TamA family outer membrane protein [Gemmatimonadota bacterium]
MKPSGVSSRIGLLKIAALVLVMLPAAAQAQQPPFEGAISPEPLEPREQLAQPALDGPDAILLAPHRLLALGLAPLLEFAVEKGLLGSGSGDVEGFKFQPGSLGAGSGLGAAVGYVVYPAPVWAGVEAGATIKGYMQHSAFIGVRDARGSNYVRVTGAYDLDTQDEFSGLGMDIGEDQETDYRQEEIRLLGDAQYAAADRIVVGARGGYRKNNILEGENDDLTDIEDRFGGLLIPGVGVLPGISGEEGKYGQGGLFVGYDSRNDARNPDRGALLAASFDAFRGLDDTPFDWNRFAGEFNGYLPLPDETRVIALRLVGIHQEPQNDQALVPFYYLASLGGSNLLRSFSSFRFQDNDLLYGAAEYRRRVWAEEAGKAALDAALFVESAGVYRDLTDNVELGDMEQSFGTELRVLVPNDVVARLGAAVGGEGVKFYIGGGGRF